MESFPLWALLPKRETTAAQFVAKYPSYDGRGIKIAILDSGVDPGADGLQTTTDGKPKIIDMMDASGAGDVDTSTVVEVDSDGNITGITGRKLKIPKSWKTPTGKYHIGVKNIYELYPKKESLFDRIQKEYTDNEWTPVHKTAQTEALRNLQQFQSSNNGKTPVNDVISFDDSISEDNKSVDTNNSKALEEKLLKEDLQSRYDILNSFEKKFVDLGPTYDCIVFHDGITWNAVIDTTGNLDEALVLQNYSECLKYGTISVRDQLNYAINIHNDGNLLEIVGMCSSHGTHVASIAAAHFPGEPVKNGVAPGAQIVSICIGDVRLGTNETASALMRAYIKVIESGCDLINMSYCEHGHWPEGRVLELAQEVVNKYGVIYVCCAGNNGPALSTISSPTMMQSSSLISVGAYVTPDMMTAEYSMHSQLPGMAYSWTSRGPTLNGDLGVSVCAPGGAITSVPNWTLKKSVLYNGTSMSAPNAAGCVALLLSSLKAQNIAYSPYSIRRSIENTALKIQNYEPLTHGNGLIQVEKAYEYLIQFKQNNLLERDIRFHISCSNNDTSNGTNQLGIYLRNSFYVDKPSLHSISINPIFLDEKRVDAKRKIEFEMTFSLVCDQQWVNCPTFLHMSYASRIISVKLDPTGLEPGYHFTLIRAYDIECPEKGPIFQIPITVIKPIEMPDKCQLCENLSLKPGYLKRQFIKLSRGTSGAVFKVKNLDTRESGTFILNALQLKPLSSCRTVELNEMNLTLTPNSELCFSLKVSGDGDCILEVVIGKWWSSIGEINIEFSINVYGLSPSQNSNTMFASDSVERVDIHSSLSQSEDLMPNISLKYLVQPLRSNDTNPKVRPLYKRDVIPEGRQCYELVLTYSLQLTKPSPDTVISCPLLTDLLFESEYDSQLWMIFDSNKQYCGTGDAYPNRVPVKLEKGDYTIRLQLRHESIAMLEKLFDVPLQVQYKLSTPQSLNIYESYRQALLLDGKKFNCRSVRQFSECPIFVCSAKWSELNKNFPISATNGCYLLGDLTLAKDETRKKSEVFTFKYVIDNSTIEPTSAKKSTSNQNAKQVKTSEISNSKQKPSLDDQYKDSINELKVSWLPKLSAKLADELYLELSTQQKLISDKISKSSLVLARIQSLDSYVEDASNPSEERAKNLQLQVTLADDILNTIKLNELIAELAVQKQQNEKKENSTTNNSKSENNANNNNNNNNNGNIKAKNLEKQKNIVLDALINKGLAICQLIDLRTSNHLNDFSLINVNEENNPNEDERNLSPAESEAISPKLCFADKVYDDICKLMGECMTLYDNAKCAKFVERHATLRAHYGRLLKLYVAQLSLKSNIETERKCIDVFAKLGWNHCNAAYKRSLHVRYPNSYRLF